MKKQLLWCMAALSFSAASAQTYETRFARPLSDVLNDVAARFQVRLKYDIDTVGRILPYADFRIRPYSLEETLTNVLSPFDYKFVKQSDTVYKLKPYEYARRTDVDIPCRILHWRPCRGFMFAVRFMHRVPKVNMHLLFAPMAILDRDATGRTNSNVWLHWRVWGLFVWIMTCMVGENPLCR